MNVNDLHRHLSVSVRTLGSWQSQSGLLSTAIGRHANRVRAESQGHADEISRQLSEIGDKVSRNGAGSSLAGAFADYLTDASQRWILSLDALRKRGDIFLEHEAAGAPPVLIYDYEVVVDGADLPRPCNYVLIRITPPEGVDVFDWKRPYMIIDPRAGHGPGIGGFKPDSQVGVALKDGHPVYFVTFRPMPEPDQVLADVTHAEAAFLREVRRRHPNAPKPIVVGNCQGCWATAILAATNPDLAGPIVLNGAPMAYWSGRLGQDPMRYSGGTSGGVLPAMILSDLGGCVFDGAHLVLNFEMLNPGRTWFRKYYDLFATIDTGEERFLEFEKWWGGFFLMNGEEIRWIVDNLFVGNRLSKNEARLETGRPIDLKLIRAPIIVFASHGDNITPPQQALNWIVDTYADEREIEIRGQRIIYMVHEQVGHLGIFVSSSVAKREHTQVASTVKTIEALPPGLFEMVIEDVVGEGQAKSFTVSFHKRKMTDILDIDGTRAEEEAFAALARLSETLAEGYDTSVRPLVKASIPKRAGEVRRALHPLRTQRKVFASANPLMRPVALWAEQARSARRPVNVDNPFLLAERLWADMVEQGWNTLRDLRALALETSFLALYANPLAIWYGAPYARRRTRKTADELRALPEVQIALDRIALGGLAEAVVRMLVLVADTRADVRQDRLARAAEVMANNEPFTAMDAAARSRMIHEQTLIVHFEPEAGLQALPYLLPSDEDRAAAIEFVEYVVGSADEMSPSTATRIDEMRNLLGQPALESTQTDSAA
ncbi:MAG: DUF3141 domain-containing protein [Geminicoccaceae bacterium]